jgi:hypothetical protein
MAFPGRIKFSANIAIYGVLWSLAAASATLPVYVHLHPNQFGPPLMSFYGSAERQMNLPQEERKRISAALLRPKLQLDQITTGSIEPSLNRTQPRATRFPPQQFPIVENPLNPAIQFISATKDRALAFVDGRLRILIPGDRLPDGRTIKGFEQANGTIRPVVTAREKPREEVRDPFR